MTRTSQRGARPWRARLSTALLLAGLVSQTANARALAEPDKALADGLFREGRALMDAKDYPAACAKFSASWDVDPALGTLMNLALCYKLRGKTASAWRIYRRAAEIAKTKGQTERQDVADAEAAALEPRLLRATLSVEADPQNTVLSITLDGNTVSDSDWNTPFVIDPGRHELQISAPGHEPRTMTFDAVRAQTVVEIRPLPKASSLDDRPRSLGVRELHDDSWSAQEITALSLGGLGLVAAGVGLHFTLDAKDTYDDADCSARNVCSERGLEQQEAGKDKAILASVAGGVGAAALATAVALWLWPQAEATAEASSTVAVVPSTSGASVLFSGRY